MEIPSVAVYSEADREAPFLAYADEAYLIGPGPSTESNLRGDGVVDAPPPPAAAGRARGATTSPAAPAAAAPRRCTPASSSWPRTPTSPGDARPRDSSSSAR